MPKNTSEVEKLMKRMYRLWNIRPRSEKEVRDYFKRLSVSSSIVDTIVERLKQLRLLSDEEFAIQWVQSRSKKKGIQQVKRELYRKGISKEIIEEVISQQSFDSQEQVAEKLLQKRLHRLTKKKAYDFLLRRGFEYELVRSIIEKLFKKD